MTTTLTQTCILKLESNDFQSYPRRDTASSKGKKMQIIQGKYFVNDTFSGFEN